MSSIHLQNSDEQIDQLVPALEKIGAIAVQRSLVRQAGETSIVNFLKWRDRIIQISNSVQGGLQCHISQPGAEPSMPNNWPTIFSYTVPDFDNFDGNQKIRWIVMVPKGKEYPSFLAEHLARLPQAIA